MTPTPPGIQRPLSRVFSLRNSGVAWLVEAGELDIFFAREDAGEAAGALLFVCRLEPGEAAFALNGDSPQSLGLFASPSPDARIQSVGEEELSPESRDRLQSGWREALSRGFPDAPPRPGEDLSAFHLRAVSLLQERQSAETEDHSRRLSARTEADDTTVRRALSRLASPLAESTAGPAVDESESALVRACRSVGRAAGITIQVPQSVIRGTARNPQRAIARASAVRSRKLVLQGDWWRHDSGPMLAFLEGSNEPVALLRRPSGRYDLFNPADQSKTRITRSTAATLSGVAWTFYRPFPPRPLDWKDLIGAGLTGSARDLRTILLTGFLASVMALITPFATGIVFDSIIPGSERNQLWQTVILISAAAAAATLIGLTRSYALLRIEGKMDFITQAAVWDRLLHMPVTFFRNFSAGDLAYRSLAISQVRSLLTGNTLSAIFSGFFSVSSIFLMAYYSLPLTLLAVSMAGVTLIVTFTGGLIKLKYIRDVNEKVGNIAGMVFEFIEGIAKFRISGSEGRAFARWADAFALQKGISVSIRRVSNFLTAFDSVFPVVATGLIYYGVAAQSRRPASGFTTGAFFAFTAAFGQLLASVYGLNSGISALLSAIPLYDRAKPILLSTPEIVEGKADPGELRGAIEINHASFRYSQDTPLILRDVSLSIAPGEFVAFTGASGSGKSTLMRLLLGFEQPHSGAVYFDGQDLAGLDLEEVRRQMGVVLQNGKLLPGDILTNIVGNSLLTVDDAWEAARMAGLEEDIRALPMGMYTMVAEGGKTLSGGQRQRLMIARAVVNKPRILLFDEATSALDNRTQSIVSKAVEQMRATRIVVAHRLSTIVNADRIFVLDQGEIVESGTYDELLRRNGTFTELAKRQLA